MIEKERISIAEAAARTGMSMQTIRIGLQQGRLKFGTAVKTSTNWTYHIPRKAFEQYLETGEVSAELQVNKIREILKEILK